MSKAEPFRVTVDALEFVDCDECRAVGKWTEIAPNKFRCECGAEVETAPCTCKGKGHKHDEG